jgi:hypothetical protein
MFVNAEGGSENAEGRKPIADFRFQIADLTALAPRVLILQSRILNRNSYFCILTSYFCIPFLFLTSPSSHVCECRRRGQNAEGRKPIADLRFQIADLTALGPPGFNSANQESLNLQFLLLHSDFLLLHSLLISDFPQFPCL